VCYLSVRLRHALQLILLLNRVRVARSLRRVDQLIRQAFRNRLDVTEGSFAGTSGQQVNRLVDTAERGEIDSLTANNTSRTNTRGIFTRTRVNDGIDDHLDRVLVSEQVNDFHGVLDDANSHELLAVVAAVHHEGVHQAFHDRALSLAEALDGVAARSVRDVHGVLRLNRDVILFK